MKAYAAVSKGVIVPIELPIPEIDDYEVLVKNEGCVFCNTTDKMIVEDLFATKDYPVVLGHENFGRVVKLGKKVKSFQLGDRVICANAIVKGYNGEYYSSWGGFAEYGIAGDKQAYLADGGKIENENFYRYRYAMNFVIPSDFSYEKASLVFPLAEIASAAKMAGDLKGKTIVVIGTGIVGYALVFFAQYFGAKKVICLGRRAERMPLAVKMGATETFINSKDMEEYFGCQEKADVIFEATGNPHVLKDGAPYLKEGGLLAIYSVTTKPYEMNMLRFPSKFSIVRVDPDVGSALEQVCQILREGSFPEQDFLTHIWNFDEVAKAYQQVKQGEVVKGLVVISKDGN